MKAEIISIGTEILLGHIVNNNAAFMAQGLASIGMDVFYQVTVGDNHARLSSTIEAALERSDVVIMTGGLGPTVDDITLQTIASVTKRSLVYNREIEKEIKASFKRRKIRPPKEVFRQAYIPKGGRWLSNKIGTAPGLIIRMGEKILIALPGPPRELNSIFEKYILPLLSKMSGGGIIKSRVLKVTGLAESQVNTKVKDLLRLGPKVTVGIYAHLGEVDLKVMAKAKTKREADRGINKVAAKIRRRFGDFVFGVDSDTLESVVGGLLIKKQKTIAVAESCTGGLISNLLTNIPGSSKYTRANVVTYCNKSKEEILGVPAKLITHHGAVSPQVCLAMAKGVRWLADTDIGLAVTGIAGPAGKKKNKPVGLVYIALATKKKGVVKKYFFSGNRTDIKLQTAQRALDMARRYLLDAG